MYDLNFYNQRYRQLKKKTLSALKAHFSLIQILRVVFIFSGQNRGIGCEVTFMLFVKWHLKKPGFIPFVNSIVYHVSSSFKGLHHFGCFKKSNFFLFLKYSLYM